METHSAKLGLYGTGNQETGEPKLKILDMLFGCRHKRLSFPMTGKRGQWRSAAARPTGTYVVCLECGREFAYDWRQMRIVSSQKKQDSAPVSVEAKAS